MSKGGDARRVSRLQPEQEAKCSQPSSEGVFLGADDLGFGEAERLAGG